MLNIYAQIVIVKRIILDVIIKNRKVQRKEMFGKKEKTMTLEELVKVEPEAPKIPQLTTEMLEELYQRKTINESRPEYKNILSVSIMSALEKIGADPININKKWFQYRVGSNPSWGNWSSHSWFNVSPAISFEYAFPLPFEAVEKLIRLKEAINFDYKINYGNTFQVSIIAPDQRLGIRNQPIRHVVDPILIAEVKFSDKKFYYHICSWNLKEDLKFIEGE
jgi:hypothetical protein